MKLHNKTTEILPQNSKGKAPKLFCPLPSPAMLSDKPSASLGHITVSWQGKSWASPPAKSWRTTSREETTSPYVVFWAPAILCYRLETSCDAALWAAATEHHKQQETNSRWRFLASQNEESKFRSTQTWQWAPLEVSCIACLMWEVEDLSLNPQMALAVYHIFLQDTAWTFSFNFLAIDCSHPSVVLCISPHWTASYFFQAIPSLCWVCFDSNPGLQSSQIHS